MQLHNIFVVWHNEQAQNRHVPVVSVFQRISIHLVNSRLAGLSIMNGQNISIHETHRPLLRHMQFKVHPNTPAEQILVFKIKICRQAKHLKIKIRSGESYNWPINSNRQMSKGLMADQHTANSTKHGKLCLLLRKSLQVPKPSVNSFFFSDAKIVLSSGHRGTEDHCFK